MSINDPKESGGAESNDQGGDLWKPADTTVAQGESLGYKDTRESRKSPDSDQPRRDNWYGNPDVETVADEHRDHGTEWSADEVEDDKAESVAWEMLLGIAPKICGMSMDDPAKSAIELTDPEVYPHGDGNRVHLRRARVNEKHGTISGGESTGVRLGDVTEQRFLSIVEILLDHWQHIGHITDELAEDLYRDAQRMKSKPDIGDKDAIEKLVADALRNKDFAAVVDMMLSTWTQAGHIDDRESKELMVEAIRLKNQPDISEREVIDRLSERALPLPAAN